LKLLHKFITVLNDFQNSFAGKISSKTTVNDNHPKAKYIAEKC